MEYLSVERRCAATIVIFLVALIGVPCGCTYARRTATEARLGPAVSADDRVFLPTDADVLGQIRIVNDSLNGLSARSVVGRIVVDSSRRTTGTVALPARSLQRVTDNYTRLFGAVSRGLVDSIRIELDTVNTYVEQVQIKPEDVRKFDSAFREETRLIRKQNPDLHGVLHLVSIAYRSTALNMKIVRTTHDTWQVSPDSAKSFIEKALQTIPIEITDVSVARDTISFRGEFPKLMTIDFDYTLLLVDYRKEQSSRLELDLQPLGFVLNPGLSGSQRYHAGAGLRWSPPLIALAPDMSFRFCLSAQVEKYPRAWLYPLSAGISFDNPYFYLLSRASIVQANIEASAQSYSWYRVSFGVGTYRYDIASNFRLGVELIVRDDFDMPVLRSDGKEYMTLPDIWDVQLSLVASYGGQ